MSRSDYRPFVPAPGQSRIAGATARAHAQARMQGQRARDLFGGWAELAKAPFTGDHQRWPRHPRPVCAAACGRADIGHDRGRERRAGNRVARTTGGDELPRRIRTVALLAEHRAVRRRLWVAARRSVGPRARSGDGGAAREPERERVRNLARCHATQPFPGRPRRLPGGAGRMELSVLPVRRAFHDRALGLAALRAPSHPQLLCARTANGADAGVPGGRAGIRGHRTVRGREPVRGRGAWRARAHALTLARAAAPGHRRSLDGRRRSAGRPPPFRGQPAPRRRPSGQSRHSLRRRAGLGALRSAAPRAARPDRALCCLAAAWPSGGTHGGDRADI